MENKEILAIVNGEEFYGSISSKDTKKDIINTIKLQLLSENRHSDENDDTENIYKELNKLYEKAVNREIINFNLEKEFIEKNLITEDEILNGDFRKYTVLMNDNFEKIYFANISQNELNNFIKEKKLQEIIFSYYIFDDIENANKCYEILNSDIYKEFLNKNKDIYNQKEETLLDIINNKNINRIYDERELEILKEYYTGRNYSSAGSSIGYSDENGGGNIYIDKNDNIFPDHMGANSEIELFIKLSKDMDNTDTTKPKKYKELGDKYYIFHLKDKRKLSEYKILEPYRLYRYENRRKEIIENLDIKYIYPEIELEKDFFARETKVAEVNGKDIYLDNWNINIYKYSNGMTKEELIESINMEIMMELREQDVYKKYYKEKEYDIDNLTEIERENIYESYSKYMHDILKIEEYELEKYIEENREKLISYEYIDFNYTGKDSNEIYNRLLKDNSANIIADIFENRYNRNINLSEKEKEILESFYFNKDISSSFFKKSLDGMSFELEKKYPNGYYKFYQNDYHIETSLQDYEDLKKMELKELSELKPIHKDFDNNYKLILLYNKIDDEDSIIKLAKEYLRIEKENDYVKELFEKADIKYFIE